MSSDSPTDLGEYLAAREQNAAAEIDDSLVDIGRRMAEARVNAGLSQAELGAQLGVLEDTVAGWEDGTLAARSNMLTRAAGVLGVSLSWLVMSHGVGPATDEPSRLEDLRQTVLDVQAQISILSRDLQRVAAELAEIAS